jgi:hypothetical protein
MTASLQTHKGLRRLVLAAAVVAPLALLPALGGVRADPSDPIEPGYWDVTTKVEPMGTKHELRCIRHDQVARFMRGEPNHHTKCTYPVQKMDNGRIELRGVCQDNSGLGGKVKTEGTYSRTSLHVVAHGTILGLPVTAHLDAHRIGDKCPAGAKS